MIQLLDGGVESIHVDMQNRARHLDVIHDLTLPACSRAFGEVFEVDVVEDRCDCAFEIAPDGFELTRAFSIAHILKVTGIETGQLDEWTADASYDVAHRDALRRTG